MEFSFDFEMTEENRKAIEEILKQKGVKHYVLETKDKEKLDLVEYKDYQELEQEKQETISFIRKELSDIEIELITPKPDIYDLGLLRGRYGTYKEILSKLDVLKITEKSDK